MSLIRVNESYNESKWVVKLYKRAGATFVYTVYFLDWAI